MSKHELAKKYTDWPTIQHKVMIKIIDEPDFFEYQDDDGDEKDEMIDGGGPQHKNESIPESKTDELMSDNEADYDDEQDAYLAPQMLSLHKVIWKWLFDQVVNDIVAHCVKILENDKMKDAKYIFLVGAFANSNYFQMRMKKEFEQNPKYPNLHVEVPTFPNLCVVDGAARYGLTPDFVKIRTMPRTYGTKCAKAISDLPKDIFDENREVDHLDQAFLSENIIKGGTVANGQKLDLLENCFSIFTRKGDEVHLDDKPVQQIVEKKDKDSESIIVKVFSSEIENPLTVIRPQDRVTLLGSVTVPVAKDQNTLAVEFHFSTTTITVYSYPVYDYPVDDQWVRIDPNSPKTKCTLTYFNAAEGTEHLISSLLIEVEKLNMEVSE